jgi:hypothetical protein
MAESWDNEDLRVSALALAPKNFVVSNFINVHFVLIIVYKKQTRLKILSLEQEKIPVAKQSLLPANSCQQTYNTDYSRFIKRLDYSIQNSSILTVCI